MTCNSNLSPQNGLNFVERNKMNAVAGARPGVSRQKENQEAYRNKKDFGKMPQYLINRNIEMAADHDARMAAKEAALIPPGMRLLSEQERLETLAMLEKNRVSADPNPRWREG